MSDLRKATDQQLIDLFVEMGVGVQRWQRASEYLDKLKMEAKNRPLSAQEKIGLEKVKKALQETEFVGEALNEVVAEMKRRDPTSGLQAKRFMGVEV